MFLIDKTVRAEIKEISRTAVERAFGGYCYPHYVLRVEDRRGKQWTLNSCFEENLHEPKVGDHVKLYFGRLSGKLDSYKL